MRAGQRRRKPRWHSHRAATSVAIKGQRRLRAVFGRALLRIVRPAVAESKSANGNLMSAAYHIWRLTIRAASALLATVQASLYHTPAPIRGLRRRPGIGGDERLFRRPKETMAA